MRIAYNENILSHNLSAIMAIKIEALLELNHKSSFSMLCEECSVINDEFLKLEWCIAFRFLKTVLTESIVNFTF